MQRQWSGRPLERRPARRSSAAGARRTAARRAAASLALAACGVGTLGAQTRTPTPVRGDTARGDTARGDTAPAVEGAALALASLRRAGGPDSATLAALLEPAGSRPIALDDVVRLALHGAVDVRAAQWQYASALAGRRTAGAPFESQFVAFVASATQRSMTGVADAGESPLTLVQTNNSYGITLQRLLRSGIQVAPTVAVARSALSTVTAAPPSVAAVNLGVTVPLARGRAGAALRAAEVAATTEVRAAAFDVQFSASRSVLAAVSAYWDYVASYARLRVAVVAEQRAAELARQTEVLVRADERSPSELLPLVANTANKRTPRIAAEQGVLEARQRLGVALGVPADTMRRIGRPVTELPVALAAGASVRADSTPADLARHALAARADLRAARARRAEADALRTGASREAEPRVDLVLATGYTGVDRSGRFDAYYRAMSRGVAGVNTSVRLNYQPWLGPSGRARTEQAQAALDRSALQVSDLERVVATSVEVAVSALRNARAQLEAADEAVLLSRTAVASESEKFRLGMATRFDVIQAEDALTGALQGRIGAQVQYAQVLARLRHESGRLLAPTGAADELRVEVGALLRAPVSER